MPAHHERTKNSRDLFHPFVSLDTICRKLQITRDERRKFSYLQSLYILVPNERDFMRKFVLSLLLLAACAHPQSQNQSQIEHQEANQHMVDDLLTTAFREGIHQEVVRPRELMWYEIALRRVGGAIFLQYLIIHNYIKKIIAFES